MLSDVPILVLKAQTSSRLKLVLLPVAHFVVAVVADVVVVYCV